MAACLPAIASALRPAEWEEDALCQLYAQEAPVGGLLTPMAKYWSSYSHWSRVGQQQLQLCQLCQLEAMHVHLLQAWPLRLMLQVQRDAGHMLTRAITLGPA